MMTSSSDYDNCETAAAATVKLKMKVGKSMA